MIGLQEVLGRHAQHLRRLGDRWLHFAFFVGAARLQHGFLAVPLPRETESRVREPKDWILKLRGPVGPSTVDGYIDLSDGASSGPRQTRDFIESATRQALASRRAGDDRFGAELESEAERLASGHGVGVVAGLVP